MLQKTKRKIMGWISSILFCLFMAFLFFGPFFSKIIWGSFTPTIFESPLSSKDCIFTAATAGPLFILFMIVFLFGYLPPYCEKEKV